MSSETRQPTTTIELTKPWSASWDGHERNDQAITVAITTVQVETGFNMAKQWEDTRSVSIGSRSETIHPHGYERIITILGQTRGPDRTKTKKDARGRRTFNWQGSGTVTYKVNSFAEVAAA